MSDEDVEETTVEAVTEPEEVPEEKPSKRRRSKATAKPKPTMCTNHPDREAVWSSDGVTASVVHFCDTCEERYA